MSVLHAAAVIVGGIWGAPEALVRATRSFFAVPRQRRRLGQPARRFVSSLRPRFPRVPPHSPRGRAGTTSTWALQRGRVSSPTRRSPHTQHLVNKGSSLTNGPPVLTVPRFRFPPKRTCQTYVGCLPMCACTRSLAAASSSRPARTSSGVPGVSLAAARVLDRFNPRRKQSRADGSLGPVRAACG